MVHIGEIKSKDVSEMLRNADEKWGDARNYHLSINSSDVTVDGAVDLIMEYLKTREKYQKDGFLCDRKSPLPD